MQRKDFWFDLPEELIAQSPLPDRDASRLLYLNRGTGAIRHLPVFGAVKELLRPGDCLVINDTKVIPARLLGIRAGGTAKVELLLLKRLDDQVWECLAKPGKRMRVGDMAVFGEGLLTGEVIAVEPDGNRLVRFAYEGIFEEVLDRLGEMPLPPYIHEKLADKNRYQTVYAKHSGSAAAPTAGLHFTKALLGELEEMGVSIAKLTLHVGLGTFRPVKADDILEHHMHSEYYRIDEAQARRINEAKQSGGRIIAVGTTVCRTLESCAGAGGFVQAGVGWTDIFIYPGYTFRIIDGLITNFHLPESTLIMLVSALAGQENTQNAYREAVRERYRFFSFGDAMVIL